MGWEMEKEQGDRGDRNRGDAREGREDQGLTPEDSGQSHLRDGGFGPAPAAPEPAPRRTDEEDTRPTWLEILLPVLIVLLLATLALLWNIIAAIVVLIIGAGVILSWVIQRRGPHEPGE
jgi:Flp pilus assembly protein TadB